MNTLIVVNEDSDYPPPSAQARTVAALDYLTQPCFRQAARVVNRCRTRDYQAVGYYVALLAEARGQQDSLEAIEGLHRARRRSLPPARRRPRQDTPAVAILYDPACPEPPSDSDAIERFRHAARALDMRTDIITQHDAGRLNEFDALFIRDTTGINHYTYRLSQAATAAGLVVIDAPGSILRCNNKVYLAELFELHGIPAPRTLLVHRDNIDSIIPALGLPCILKLPDGAFSLGVVKVTTEQQLRDTAEQFLRQSALIVAQEYLPTDFDWRIGILDRKPLFACKYFMAPGHWQIIKRQQDVKLSEGHAAALPLEQVPDIVLKSALDAANLIGDGMYGVDLKQIGDECVVIEVNDNPNVDSGNEDGVLQDELYREVMRVFRRRIADAVERRT